MIDRKDGLGGGGAEDGVGVGLGCIFFGERLEGMGWVEFFG